MKLDNVVASQPDDRDIMYVPNPGPFSDQVDLHAKVFVVENQADEGACTAFGVCGAAQDRKPGIVRAHQFNYFVSRHIYEGSTGDTGAQTRDALRAAFHFGLPPEASFPYGKVHLDEVPSEPVFAEALQSCITRYERIATPQADPMGRSQGEQDQIKAAMESALDEGLSIVVATRLGQQFYTLNGPWQAMNYLPSATGYNSNNGNTFIGNHCWRIVGKDNTLAVPGRAGRGKVLGVNSWSAQWGDGGYFGMAWDYLMADLMEAWIVRSFIDPYAPPVPYVTQPAVVLQWYWEAYRRDVTDPNDPNVQYWAMHPGGEKMFLTVYRQEMNGEIDKRLAAL